MPHDDLAPKDYNEGVGASEVILRLCNDRAGDLMHESALAALRQLNTYLHALARYGFIDIHLCR